MQELRITDTNAADDSAGRAFGLEGNLYLVVVCAALAGLGLYALLALAWQVAHLVAALLAAPVPIASLAWALVLRHGKPPGYDRDWLELRISGGSFSRKATAQEGMA